MSGIRSEFDGPASRIGREAAESLARGCLLGVLSYPAILWATILVTPGGPGLSFTLPCAALQLLIVAVRLAAMLPFDLRYTANPARWRRNFHAGAYGSAVVWLVFALGEMNANGAAWPTWMIVLMTSGIAAGATSSLCSDPQLLNRLLPVLLGPLAAWGLAQRSSYGNAIAVVMAIYLAFILVQARNHCRAFRQSALDKQALRDVGRRRDALVDSIDGILWEADPQSRQFTFISGRAETMLGYPVERWTSETSFWKDHVHPGDLEGAIRYADTETAAGRDYTMEYRMLAADGRAVWFRDIVSVVRQAGHAPVLRGVMVDITARRRANEERKMLADALRTVREAVSITDLEDRILFVNNSFLDLYGYTREEVQSASILLLRSGKNPPELGAAIAAGTRRGGWQGELWNRAKDGREFPISLSTSLVHDPFGRVIAQVGVGAEITQRKNAEDELKRARDAAERANQSKSAFLANMSHEIRTPMNGILGMAGLLLDGDLDPRQRQRAETIRDSAESLLGIVNDVLDFSKMGAGKLKLKAEPFDLRDVVDAVAGMMALKAQESGVEMLCRIEPDVPTQWLGDGGRLRQVLVNLCGNAVKFTPAGEVSIRVKRASPGEPERVRFEVSDTGVGIREDQRHLLFRPFSQVDSSAAGRFGGTGLGLSIVRMLVEIMGGEVGLRSQEGQGSCFWFTVPVVRQSGPEPQRALSLDGSRFLVVDRNAASRSLMRELLEQWQAGTEEAGDQQAALDLVRSSTGPPFDALFVDLDTLGSHCRQFLSVVREHRTTAGAAVVLMAPLTRSAEAERWCRLGFAGPIAKPVRERDLAACLASMRGHAPATGASHGPNQSRNNRDARSKLRLLVVEDNQVNQQVALGILECLGYRADVASDGRDALSALGRQDYDLVLMDCQMPVMDGYEATRLIRRGDTAVRNHEIPIVATTAHAMAGDREKCLAAGMNDFVSKPLRRDAVEKAIEQWTAGIRTADLAPMPATVAGVAAFDREALVERLLGNEELAHRIVRTFVADMPGQIGLLARAVSEGDPKQARLIAHSIKGAAANVGGLEVREAAWKLEQQSSAGDLAAAVAVLPELSASFERVRPWMDGFCAEDPAGS